MERNDGGPAFPTGPEMNVVHTEFGPGEYPTGYKAGMSLRAYYAAHAPENVPDWYRHQPRPAPRAPYTEIYILSPPDGSGCRPELQDLVDGWRRDACFDLVDVDGDWTDKERESLAAYEKGWNAYWTERVAWERNDTYHRYFQWRWYYADEMLKHEEDS